jgi:hypothetical protein
MVAGRIPLPQAIAAPGAAIKTSSRGAALWFAGAILVVNLAGLLLLVLVAGITTETYALERLEAERQRWLAGNFELESEAAQLQSLNRIEREAREKLRMVPATDYVYVTVPVAPAPPAERPPEGNAPAAPAPDAAAGPNPLRAVLHLLGIQP